MKKSKADRGYVVVQNTRTGEVLAMANAPGFDPNDLSQADSAALGNAALQDAYEPGSTSKVMSMAAVLEEKAATPATHVVVPNRLHRGDRLFKDDIDHPTWYLTLNGVLAKSSNIGTILATGQLGKTQPEASTRGVAEQRRDDVVIQRPAAKEDAAQSFPQVQVLDRPEHLRAGTVPMNDVLRHDIAQVPADAYLQTHSTNPLLRAETVSAAIERFEADGPGRFSIRRDAHAHPLVDGRWPPPSTIRACCSALRTCRRCSRRTRVSTSSRVTSSNAQAAALVTGR